MILKSFPVKSYPRRCPSKRPELNGEGLSQDDIDRLFDCPLGTPAVPISETRSRARFGASTSINRLPLEATKRIRIFAGHVIVIDRFCRAIPGNGMAVARVEIGIGEPHAAIAEYDALRDRLTVKPSTQVPYYVHLMLEQTLGMPK